MILEGRALDWLETTLRRLETQNQDREVTVLEVLAILRRRFEREDGRSALLRLNNVEQGKDEPVEEFAERLWELAYRAFPKFDQHSIESHVTFLFCKGLADKKSCGISPLSDANIC